MRKFHILANKNTKTIKRKTQQFVVSETKQSLSHSNELNCPENRGGVRRLPPPQTVTKPSRFLLFLQNLSNAIPVHHRINAADFHTAPSFPNLALKRRN
jgi:hypothetical protein